MKIKHCLFRAGLAAFIVVALAGCFSPWAGGEGTLTLHLGGDSGGRFPVDVDNGEQDTFTYTVTLSGPGPSITETFSGGTTHTFRVHPGTWNVEVKGWGKIPELLESDLGAFPDTTLLRAYGEKTVAIRAGSGAVESIEMYPAAEAANFAQLDEAFGTVFTDGKEYVFVTGDIAVSNYWLTVTSGQNIELRAGKKVTITRGGSYNGEIFTVQDGGTLTLGKANGNAMNLNIYGGGEGETSANSLIIVEGNMVMNDARIYGNNVDPGNPANPGGVLVDGPAANFTMFGGQIDSNTGNTFGGGVGVGSTAGGSGTFIMHGGSIDGNKVSDYGGQVYVGWGCMFEMKGGTLSGRGSPANTDHADFGGGVYIDRTPSGNGNFIKTGGTIYGSNETGPNKLSATTDGDAVLVPNHGTALTSKRDTTLGPNDPLSTEDWGTNWD